MIRHTQGEPVKYVEYDLVFEGKTLDTIGPEQGGMKEALARALRNPGMKIVATVVELLGEDQGYDTFRWPSRVVFPIS